MEFGQGGVYRVGLPRTDLTITLDGVQLKPSSALGSWFAFVCHWDEVMVMRGLVLTEDEVNLMIKAPRANGNEVAAVHNHMPGSRRDHNAVIDGVPTAV